MEVYWIWWLAAVVLVIAEINSGTFYLIAVAFGLAAAGLSAYLGMAWGGQAAIAALLCTVSVAGYIAGSRPRGRHWNRPISPMTSDRPCKQYAGRTSVMQGSVIAARNGMRNWPGRRRQIWRGKVGRSRKSWAAA